MGAKRKRSPAFPYVGMQDVTQYLRSFYDASKGNFSPINLAFKSMNLTTTSSTSNRIMSTMLGYGILLDEGARNEKKIKVTQLGERLLKESREELLIQAKREAVLNDEMMSNIFNKWKNSLPNDDIMQSTLVIDFQFTEDAAKRFIKVIRENYSYAGLDTYNYLLDQPENNEKINSRIIPNADGNGNMGDRKTIKDNDVDEVYGLDFTLTLGINQEARLQISNKLSKDDFEFLLTWIKRLENDITDEDDLKDEDIPF